MGLDSIIAARPQFGASTGAYNPEDHVRECVAWLQRVLRPVDEHFFYHVVEQLLADQPEAIRLEVQSRIYQMIPRTGRACAHRTIPHGIWTEPARARRSCGRQWCRRLLTCGGRCARRLARFKAPPTDAGPLEVEKSN